MPNLDPSSKNTSGMTRSPRSRTSHQAFRHCEGEIIATINLKVNAMLTHAARPTIHTVDVGIRHQIYLNLVLIHVLLARTRANTAHILYNYINIQTINCRQ